VVDLGCANPANIGLTGNVLAAADSKVGGQLRCCARAISPQGRSGPQIMAGPTGLGPSQIQSAYTLAGLNGGGRTVAIVDAYNDPNAASDLATYRKAYGLSACTTASGCFKQVNESGATSPLPSNSYGGSEASSETTYDSYYNHSGMAITVSSGDSGYGSSTRRPRRT